MYEPWAALLVGAGGGIGFIAVHHAMISLKLDDPLGERENMTIVMISLTSSLQMLLLCTVLVGWWASCQCPGSCIQVS